MVRIGKHKSDNYVWGKSHNDFHRSILGGHEFIELTVNGNNPPTVNAGSRFAIYKTEYSTISSTEVTGNTVYAPGSTGEYFTGEAVFESVARAFAWGTSAGAIGSTQGNANYYLYCTGAEDVSSTSVGMGTYIVSTKLPTYSDYYGGWYSTDLHRALGGFVSSGGTVKEVFDFHGVTNTPCYSGLGLSSTTVGAIVLNKGFFNIGNQIIHQLQNVTIVTATTNLTAATWYLALVNEATGFSTYVASTSLSGYTPTVASNQMNMLSIFDEEKGYCSAGGYRVVGLFKTSSGSTTVQNENMISIFSRPNDYAVIIGTTGTPLGNAVNTPFPFSSTAIVFDMNNSISFASTIGNFTCNNSNVYNMNAFVGIAASTAFAVSGTKEIGMYIGKNSVISFIINRQIFGQLSSAASYAIDGNYIKSCYAGEAISLWMYQGLGATLTSNSVVFKISEV